MTLIDYKPQEQLSGFLRRFNVGIIPFRINNFTMGVFPNKFYEYMACGIPVVTTSLPDLKKYSRIIGYSYTYEEFRDNCLHAINGQFVSKIKDYKVLAQLNSWKVKAEQINKYIIEMLKTE